MPLCRQFTPPPTGRSNYRSVFCTSGFAKANCILLNLMCVNIINRHLQFSHTVISNSLLLLLSRFSRVRLCATPSTAAHQSPCPWDSPGKNTGVGCHFLLQCMKEKSEGEVAQSCPTLSDPMDWSLPGSSIHGFSRQEYWSGVPLPSLCNPMNCNMPGLPVHH